MEGQKMSHRCFELTTCYLCKNTNNIFESAQLSKFIQDISEKLQARKLIGPFPRPLLNSAGRINYVIDILRDCNIIVHLTLSYVKVLEGKIVNRLNIGL